MKKLSAQPADEVARVFEAIGFEPIIDPIEITSLEQMEELRRKNKEALEKMREMGYEP